MASTPGGAEKIRDKLDRGLLPFDAPVKIYGGHGQGLPCDACDEPILPAQVEYEFDTEAGGRIRLHIGCAALWEAERRRRRRPRRGDTGDPAAT